MNRVAVCVNKFQLTVLAFVLMDNHFHFVVNASTREMCISFVNEFKRLTAIFNKKTYNEQNSLEKLPINVEDVNDEDYLKTLICYVIKNPTKARISMFYDYPWGSGQLYFRRSDVSALLLNGAKPWRDYSATQLKRIFSSRIDIPDNWLISNNYILPNNYVQTLFVEQLFGTTKSYMYFLSLNKDKEVDSKCKWNAICLSDIEMRQARNEFSKELFGTEHLHSLSIQQRIIIAKKLHQQYSISNKQLSRVLAIPLDEVKKIF